jgi:hypothetical protein
MLETRAAFCLLANMYSFAASGISPVDARPFRREMEAAWLERLKRARSRYEEKVAIRRQMVESPTEKNLFLWQSASSVSVWSASEEF